MAETINQTLERYKKWPQSKWKSMIKWPATKNKDFSCTDALKCILIATEGNFDLTNIVIGYLTNKRNTFGRRGHCYVDGVNGPLDIVKSNKGSLELIGFDKDKFKNNPLPERLAGQHIPNEKRNRGRKTDGSPTELMKKTKKDIEKLRDMLFDLFPQTNNKETASMNIIRNYAINMHYSIDKVIRLFKEGKLTFDVDTMEVKPVKQKRPRIGTKVTIPENRMRRIIRINESTANEVREKMEMTEYKFNNAIKKFLRDLLEDPVNAKSPLIMQHYGYPRCKLISILRMNNMLHKQEKINDQDSDGNPTTAKMKVKFMVPKKNFDRKLRNLYIKLFEKNVPIKDVNIDECEGGATGGTGTTSCGSVGTDSMPVQPVFGMMRGVSYNPKKKSKDKHIDETLGCCTANGGGGTGNGYDDMIVPLGGDAETLTRQNGKGGATSIPKYKVG